MACTGRVIARWQDTQKQVLGVSRCDNNQISDRIAWPGIRMRNRENKLGKFGVQEEGRRGRNWCTYSKRGVIQSEENGDGGKSDPSEHVHKVEPVEDPRPIRHSCQYHDRVIGKSTPFHEERRVGRRVTHQ